MAEILIIDDDSDIRRIWATVLEVDGHDVKMAGDGAQGLELFKDNPVDVVVTDILMPVMDGLETVMAVKKTRPETKVIVVSGGGMQWPLTYLETAMRLGADLCFDKPLSIKDLRSAVTGVCGDNNLAASPA